MRRALAPRSLLRFLLRPATLVAIVVLAGLAVALTVVGPFGFAHGFNKVAGSNTYGPVSPIEALGIWPASNYRLDAAGGAQLTGLAGAIAALALLVGVAWWVRRRDLAVPIALGACTAPLPRLAAVQRRLLAGEGADDRGAAGDAARAAAAAGRARQRGAHCGGSPGARSPSPSSGAPLYSSFLALRDAPVGPPGHGAELRAFLPTVHGKPVLYAGQDRYAAYELLGADTHVPLVEFPDNEVSQNPEKPFDTGDAYSPIDFDSFSRGTLDRFRYVITGRAAWNSQAPANFRRIAATPSFVLWERTGPTPARPPRAAGGDRGRGAGRLRRAGDPHPHLEPGARLALPGAGDRRESALGRGQRARHRRDRRRRR